MLCSPPGRKPVTDLPEQKRVKDAQPAYPSPCASCSLMHSAELRFLPYNLTSFTWKDQGPGKEYKHKSSREKTGFGTSPFAIARLLTVVRLWLGHLGRRGLWPGKTSLLGQRQTGRA